ncbi:hypothetical protein C8R48DRAFT_672716 [Suillus tomentosus]|nr:hypothetical protein C8R48DRAFT_672716 [Suillus tomentosus]
MSKPVSMLVLSANMTSSPLPPGSYDPEIAIVLDGPGAPPKKSDGSDMYTVHVLNDLILVISLANPRENLLLKAHLLHVSEMLIHLAQRDNNLLGKNFRPRVRSAVEIGHLWSKVSITKWHYTRIVIGSGLWEFIPFIMTKSTVLAKGVLKDAGAMISTWMDGVTGNGNLSCHDRTPCSYRFQAMRIHIPITAAKKPAY